MKIKYAYRNYIRNLVIKYKESDMFARRMLLNLNEAVYLYPDEKAPDGLLYVEYKYTDGDDIIVVHITTDYVSKCSSSTHLYLFSSLLTYKYVIDELGSLWKDNVVCRDLADSLVNNCDLNCSLDKAIIEESNHFFSDTSIFICYKNFFKGSFIKIKEPESLAIDYYYLLYKDYNIHFNNLTLTFGSFIGLSYSDNYRKCFEIFEELLQNTHFTFNKLEGIKLCSFYTLSIDEFLIHIESHLSNLDIKLREILMNNHPKLMVDKGFHYFKSIEFKELVKRLEIINVKYGNIYDITDLVNLSGSIEDISSLGLL